MKITRRHRHFRPRPARAQILQQIRHLSRRLQLFQLEWLLEAGRPDRNPLHLRRLHEQMVACQDEIDTWETL
jgi:hypothetical protein